MWIIVIFISGCDSKKPEDEARKEALKRDSKTAEQEAKRYNLSICNLNDKEYRCAKGGKGCKGLAIATEPAHCKTPPTLLCICPEHTVCWNVGTALLKDWNIWKCSRG